MTIKEAVTAAGGAAAVAEKFNISPVSVYEWISKDRLPVDRVIPLAAMTAWHFTPHLLDSVIYPGEMDGVPDDVRDGMSAHDRRSLRDRRKFFDRRAAERNADAAAAAPKDNL